MAVNMRHLSLLVFIFASSIHLATAATKTIIDSSTTVPSVSLMSPDTPTAPDTSTSTSAKTTGTSTTTTTTTSPPLPKCPNGADLHLETPCPPSLYTEETLLYNGTQLTTCCPFLISKSLNEKGIIVKASRSSDCGIAKCARDDEVCEESIWSNLTDADLSNCYPVHCPLTKKMDGLKFCQVDGDCGDERQCHEPNGWHGVTACCGVDLSYMCPGSYYPRLKTCPAEGYVIPSSQPQTCCPVMVSARFKAHGIDWFVSGEPSVIAANTAKGCGTACRKDEYCDESNPLAVGWGEGNGAQLQNCYKIPKSHGEQPTNVIVCKTHGDCDLTSGGQLCDKRLAELNPELQDWKGVGICSQFLCPLSQQVISKGGQEAEDSVCQDDTDCETEQKQCHPLGLGKKFKACCTIDKQYHCPGGFFPSKVKDKFNHVHGEDFSCTDNEFVFKKDPEMLCCPKFISYEFHSNGLSGKPGIAMEPANPKKLCNDHAACTGEDEFCGKSMLKSQEKRLSLTASHCYKKPPCTGTNAATLTKKGLKFCPITACGTNEVCDQGLGSDGAGICCYYKCNATLPEVKPGTLGEAKKICTNCGDSSPAVDFCDEELANNDANVDVCEKTGTGKYRQCTYPRTAAATCPASYHSPMRVANHVVKPCTKEYDCRTVTDLKERSRCVGSGVPSLDGKGGTFCCRADLCSDFYLMRKDEKQCTKPEDCSEEGSNGSCEADSLGIDKTARCCPVTVEASKDRKIEIQEPFRSLKNCTKLKDCYGEQRFCDPFTQRCMYHKKVLIDGEDTGVPCSKDVADCGDKRLVCMEMYFGPHAPRCFRHPQDDCASNDKCYHGYCAPKQPVTTAEEYATSFRTCRPAPKDALLNQTGTGFMHCKDDADCPSKDLVCELSDKSAITLPGHGYCKQKISVKCHGKPLLKYVRGKLATCSRNSECNTKTHFCDLNAEPEIGGGAGICCSLPIDCGGEAVTQQDAGLKICTADDGCSLPAGEICASKITTGANTLWKTGEGVCCRMTCPMAQTGDLEPVSPPAGRLCGTTTSCSSDVETVRMCVSTKSGSGGEQRCCEYKRRVDLCTADKTDGMILTSDFKAYECNAGKKCPDQSRCFNGVCCKFQLCSDTEIRLTAQPQCTREKDCNQPMEYMASCHQGFCCPKATNGTISEPYVTTKSCATLDQCPDERMFCHPKLKKCTYFGNDKEFESTETCKRSNLGCKMKAGSNGVCVYPDADRTKRPLCWANPLEAGSQLPQNPTSSSGGSVEEEESGKGATVGIIVVAVLVVMLLVGGYMYWRYSQKKKAETKRRKQLKQKKQQQEKAKKLAKVKAATAAEKPSDKTLSEQSAHAPSPGSISEVSQNKKTLEPLRPLFVTL